MLCPLPNPETELRSPALQVDSLPAEPPGKPKNTGVGSLSLLQGIFLSQESNQVSCIEVDSLPAELVLENALLSGRGDTTGFSTLPP